MPDYEGRDRGNGKDLYNYGSSPQPRGDIHGGHDDYSDSESQGALVLVRRPCDHNPSLTATLGPNQPNPNLNLAAGGLEGPNHIFVGGLPYYFTEAQIRDLLESFGPLRGFDLVKDRETGYSKGYAFCVYEDLSISDIACAALNGIKMGEETLTVRRAHQGITQPKPEKESELVHRQQQIALQPGALAAEVTCSTEVVSVDELRESVATFFSHVMSAIGGDTACPGDAVVNVYINHEKKFAFVEMRSVEEASNAMALDGIIFEGAPVMVRRPSDYNTSLAAPLATSQPNPNLNLATVGLTPGSAGGLEDPDRICVGGLPYYITEVQIRELLECFGPLRGLDVVKDRETGNLKGNAFCVYQDLSVTDIACAALNGIKMGDKTLTVRSANRGTLVNVVIPRPKPNDEPSPGVFLEYADVDSALKAQIGLKGGKLDGNQVVVVFYPENKFFLGEFDILGFSEYQFRINRYVEPANVSLKYLFDNLKTPSTVAI
ncbi:hypothetical protein F0562_006429 [Nyssa sinensis]|uniref:RRM domain-containing protein n=1 Tax=Nyssa sinensis TaxID=561372 RepID=A0A5J5ANH6_9ASTE|nr:hypothetical protein F0562_006429 [Nyssa sinensis]